MGNMTKDEQTRLDRIEEKIDKMTEAIVSLARAEEKIVNLEKSVAASLSQLIDIDSRVRVVEKKADDSESKFKNMGAFLWILITAFVTSIFALLFGEGR